MNIETSLDDIVERLNKAGRSIRHSPNLLETTEARLTLIRIGREIADSAGIPGLKFIHGRVDAELRALVDGQWTGLKDSAGRSWQAQLNLDFAHFEFMG